MPESFKKTSFVFKSFLGKKTSFFCLFLNKYRLVILLFYSFLAIRKKKTQLQLAWEKSCQALPY